MTDYPDAMKLPINIEHAALLHASGYTLTLIINGKTVDDPVNIITISKEAENKQEPSTR